MFSLGQKLRIKPAFYFTILFNIFAFSVHAQQNLVLNGDMEEYSSCPQSESYPSQNIKEIEKCIGWRAPTYGTSDYFNFCSTGSVGVPTNILGEQQPFNGNGYLGGFLTSYTGGAGEGYSGIMWWEYIQGRTVCPLESGKIYKLSMEISLAEYSDLMINKIGTYFSVDPVSSPNTASLTVQPQCVFNNPDYFRDTLGWMHLETLFMANGGEQFLTIGNFRDDIATDTLRRMDVSQQGMLNPFVTYMYIDDVVLTEASVEIPNVFSPNGDGVNDNWNFSFPFEVTADNTVYILNRWGNVVYESPIKGFEWDGKTSDGLEATEGTYFYRVKNTNIAGFIELVR